METIFRLIHGNARGLRLVAMADAAAHDGAIMDAPESLPIGCTSKRQDLTERGFDAFGSFVEVCIMRCYGHAASMTAFERECAYKL